MERLVAYAVTADPRDKEIKALVGVLQMVRDADDDRMWDGMAAIPPSPRAKIDEVLAKHEGGAR